MDALLNEQSESKEMLNMLLSEQKATIELLQALKSNELKKEEQQIGMLIKYVDNMQAQYAQMRTEVESMKGQLQKITNTKLKSEVGEVVSQAEAQTGAFGRFIESIKIKIVNLFRNALNAFKNLGVNALRKSVSAMKIAPMLNNMEQKMRQNADSCTHKAKRLENIWRELYLTKKHIGNLGRALAGRNISDETAVPQKGIIKGIMDKSNKYVSMADAYKQKEYALHDKRSKLEKFLSGNNVKMQDQEPQVQPVQETEEQQKQEPQPVQETDNQQNQESQPAQEIENKQELQPMQETDNQQEQTVQHPAQEMQNQKEPLDPKVSIEQLAAVVAGMQQMMQEFSQRFGQMEKAAVEQSASLEIPLQMPKNLSNEKFNEIKKQWKEDGARFDNETKTWYISPKNKNADKFRPYIKKRKPHGKNAFRPGTNGGTREKTGKRTECS